MKILYSKSKLRGKFLAIGCLASFVMAMTTAQAQNIVIPQQLKNSIKVFKNAEEVNSFCKTNLDAANEKITKLEQSSAKDFALKWNEISEYIDNLGDLDLLSNVHPDKAIRTAAEDCTLLITQFGVKVYQNEKIYNIAKKMPVKDAIDIKLRNDLLESFEETGVKFSPEKREQFRELNKQYDKLEQEFSRNIRDNKTTVAMTTEELKGLPASYIEMLKKDEKGVYQLTFDYPQYLPFMIYADNAEARKRYNIAFFNRGSDKNIEILDQIVKLRSEIAALFGLSSYADYKIKRRMVKNPQEVRDFLEKIRGKITEVERAELATLAKYRAEKEKISLSAAKIERWDAAYYENKYKEEKFGIDKESLRKYFPLEPTVEWVLAMTSRLYGIKLIPRKQDTWHEEVRYFDVQDVDSGKIISALYMDLFPREGKYGHAAVWPVHGSSTLSGRLPTSALITNFNRKGFNQDEVRTFLHEFGHAVHGILSNTRYLDQSGTNVERDFVEAPSQMYEAWGKRLPTLATLKEFCQNCPEITNDLVKRLDASEKFGKGIHYARQLLYADYDMTLYGREYKKKPMGALKLWQEMEQKTLLGYIPETKFPGNFSHISGGYAAGYYGYMWSQVIALDLANSFGDNLLDVKRGRAFRDKVLSQGGQYKGIELVKSFLGRHPTTDAFFREITGQ